MSFWLLVQTDASRLQRLPTACPFVTLHRISSIVFNRNKKTGLCFWTCENTADSLLDYFRLIKTSKADVDQYLWISTPLPVLNDIWLFNGNISVSILRSSWIIYLPFTKAGGNLAPGPDVCDLIQSVRYISSVWNVWQRDELKSQTFIWLRLTGSISLLGGGSSGWTCSFDQHPEHGLAAKSWLLPNWNWSSASRGRSCVLSPVS